MPFVSSRGMQIHYEVHGTKGIPVLFCSGMGGSSHFWEPQIKEISEKHKVILYDQAGSGKSDLNILGDQTINGMAEDVLAIIKSANVNKVHFVGHAIGAIIGLQITQIDSSKLASLVLLNAWVNADAYLRRCFEIRKLILENSGPSAYLQAQPIFLYPQKWIADNELTLDEHAKNLLKSFPPSKQIIEKINIFLNYDGSKYIEDISTDCMVMTSNDDFLVPPYLTKRMHMLLKNSELKELDWGGHAFTSVRPQVFNNDALAFFKRVEDNKI